MGLPMTDREIILALFHPQNVHNEGCLVHDHHIRPRGPCTCGFAEVIGNYRKAIIEGKKIATKHYGSTYNAKEDAE